MKRILVSGSIAYDYIMDCNWTLSENIKKTEDWEISSYFLINELKRETWWTWLNIAFNLASLWEDAILLWSIWTDFEFDSLVKEKLNLNYIHKSRDLLSASAYIINDYKWWIINSFYLWAMEEADNTSVNDVRENISYAIVSPNKKEAMLKHLEELKMLWIKTFFDPGQQIWAFEKDDLELAFSCADYLIVNEHEYEQIKKKSWKSEVELLEFFDNVIVTLWEKGSKIVYKDRVSHIKACEVEEVVDPTWAWDAYRAWLLKWLKCWFDFEISAKIWTITSSYCVQFHWGQNHFVNKWLIEEDMLNFYWIEINLW